MKKTKGFLFLVFLFSLLYGCNDTSVNNSSSNLKSNFKIAVWDYSDNHYFIDTIYKESFLAVMNDSAGILPQEILERKIKTDLPSFQVWVQCENTVPDKRIASAWIMLPERPVNGYDSAIYLRQEQIMDSCFYCYFRELNSSEYYINPLAGFIGLKINVPESYAVAVSYETNDGKKYGKGKYETNVNESMILKMIKCSNQSPDATPRAWELKMKNVYRLPVKNISEASFILDAYYNSNNVMLLKIPGFNLSLSSMLLLDRYKGTTRKWSPDGKFDFIENRTIITETGDIIFPTLQPFSNELRNAGLDSNYIFNDIYKLRKSEAQISEKANLYFLTGYAQSSR